MAPPGTSKRANIVRSGNAGNSSKLTAPSIAIGQQPDNSKPVALFPPGFKTPVKLLQERCQHNAWEKPAIEHKRFGKGFTAVVFLRKKDKKDASVIHSVRLEPRPPLELPTAEEAKHWGATYALYRVSYFMKFRAHQPCTRIFKDEAPWAFCNNLSLHRVLPPGPKEYWAKLEIEKKNTPSHRAWEYDPDPFAAALEVKKRQQAHDAQASKSVQATSSTAAITAEIEARVKSSKSWSRCPELKMDLGLRDQTEQVIRRVMASWSTRLSTAPSASDLEAVPSPPIAFSLHSHGRLLNEFVGMGFRAAHVTTALSHLSNLRKYQPSATESKVATALMQTFLGGTDRDALLQYLTLIVPEDDLPMQFQPTNHSNAFVTGTSGPAFDFATLDLRTSWILTRLTKTYGFPVHAAEQALQASGRISEGTAIEVLNRRLIGCESDTVQRQVLYIESCEDNDEVLCARDEKRDTERQALLSIYGDGKYQVVPEAEETDFDIVLSSPGPSVKDDLRLRLSFHAHSLYPCPASLLSASIIPTFSVVSSTLPAYIRLSLSKMLMERFHESREGWCAMLEFGDGGVIFEMVDFLEENWHRVVADPPDVADVMFNLIAPKRVSDRTNTQTPSEFKAKTPMLSKISIKSKALQRNAAVDRQLFERQQAMRSNTAHDLTYKFRQSLPASFAREEFLAALQDPSKRTLVIAGETGSGKTTQLPQFVIESEIDANRGSVVNIICTQPRRVSAIGVATRVAAERLENIDDKDGLVGYTIRGERKSGPQTKLLFATTGVLLRRLATSDPDLQGVSHVFVDEVHERNLESDLLLLELRQVLKRNHEIKVILMSATANQELFANYFGQAAMIKIAGRTFPVKDLYLEEYLGRLDYIVPTYVNQSSGTSKTRNEVERVKSEQIRQHFVSLDYDEKHARWLESMSKASRRFDETLIASLVAHIIKEIQNDPIHSPPGVILIFVSGVTEISATGKAVESRCGSQVECFPLHSQLSTAEQKKVFGGLKSSKIKVVVATNIAETSITIPDVRYVIDNGREKQLMLDAETGMSKLTEINCSRAAAKQRRGRAGRTGPGVAFKLYTKLCEQDSMSEDTEPEMLRTQLETLFLQVKAIREEEDVPTYLKGAITPPPQLSVDHALDILERVGAFHNGNLTALGKHLAQLPLDLRLGKLLILGAIFKVFEAALTLAAMLSVNKPLFNSPFDKREEANRARLRFATSKSDLLTNIKAFDEYVQIKKEGMLHIMQKNFLSSATIRDVISSRADLLSHMQERGFIPMDYENTLDFRAKAGSPAATLNSNAKNLNLVKSVFLAGLTQVARIELPETKYDQVASGTVAKDIDARSVKFYDPKLGRVFLHPSSILFKSAKDLKVGFLTYFSRSATVAATDTKIYLRDATVVPLFGVLLLFGTGSIKIHPQMNGLSIRIRGGSGSDEQPGDSVKLRAPLRIGTLCNQLRHLIDALLQMGIDRPGILGREMDGQDNKEIIDCVVKLIETDGMTGSL